jgi:hypothetical protein
LALVLFSSAALDRNKKNGFNKKPHKIFFVFLGLGLLVVLIITSSALLELKNFKQNWRSKNGKNI